MLTIENLSVSYGEKQVLRNIQIQLEDERIHAVIGKSGSGKTTLLRAICGIQPFSGRVLLNNSVVNAHKHRLALVPQKNALIPWQTIRDNITLPLLLRGGYEEDAFQEMCRNMGIRRILDKYPNHVSGGEQQRAAICRAFLFHPDLLLLDEPFSALDAITKDEVREIFLSTIRSHKVTTLLITHDMDEALFLAERIFVLKDGYCRPALSNPLFGITREEEENRYRDMRQELRAAL